MPSENEQLKARLAPLRKSEERRAREAALRAAARGTDAERLRVLATEVIFEKPPRGRLPVRLVDVVITDPGKRRNLSVLVDQNGKVVRVEALDTQPPFQPDEIDEARALAERDPRARAVARRRGAFVSVFSPSTHGMKSPGRIVGLRYAIPGRRGSVAHAATGVVELWTGELLSFELVEPASRKA